LSINTDTLQIKIVQKGGKVVGAELESVAGDLSQIDKKSRKSADGINVLSGGFSSFGRVLGGLALGASVGALLSKLTSVNSEAQITAARFAQLEGSSVLAERSILRLAQATADMPIKFSEITDSAVKLKNLGLDASSESLHALGNIATGSGKSLDQLIEAVADASSLEFERLKEFGIKTSQSANQVKFTFRGVTTSVEKDAASITSYLKGLGEVQYAGAMEQQSGTIKTGFTELSNAVYLATMKLGESSGFNAALASATSGLADLIKTATGAPRALKDIRAELDALENRKVGRRGRGAKNQQISGLQDELDDALLLAGGTEAIEVINRRLAAATVERLKILDALSDAGESATSNRKGSGRNKSRASPLLTKLEAENKSIEALNNSRALMLAELDRDVVNQIAFDAGDPADDKGYEAALKAADKRLADMEKEIALFGETTVAAKLRYELEIGALSVLDESSKKRLMAVANERDAQVAASELFKQQKSEAMKAAEDEAQALAQITAGLSDYNAQLKEASATAGEALTLQMRSPEEIFADLKKEYTELLEGGDISPETFNRAMDQARESLAELKAQGTDVFSQLTNAMDSWGQRFTDTLVDATMTGKANFSDFAKSVIADLLRIFYQEQIVNALVAGGKSYLNGGGATATTASAGGTNQAAMPLAAVQSNNARGFGGAQNQMPMSIDIQVSNSGEGKQVQSATPKFDGKNLVLDVMLADLKTGGPYVSSLKSSTNLRQVS